MEDLNSEWQRKGATLSDKAARKEFGLTQEEIADQLRVSRSPVLQALRLLKKDGLIEDAPGRGVQVAPLDPAWVAHLYQVRGALDALAAKLAAAARMVTETGKIGSGSNTA